MPNRSANEKGTGLLVMGRRRRLVVWLLFGWLAFWFTTAAQACCICLAADPGSIAHTSAIYAGELAVPFPGSLTVPSLPDTDCDALSAIGPGAPNAATAAVERLDLPTAPPLAPEQPALISDAHALSALFSLHPPTSGVPLYLRNQRLLI